MLGNTCCWLYRATADGDRGRRDTTTCRYLSGRATEGTGVRTDWSVAGNWQQRHCRKPPRTGLWWRGEEAAVQAPHESPIPHIPPHQHLDVVDVVHISRHCVRHAAVVQRQQAAGLEARGEEPPERGERAQGAHGQCGCVGGGESDFGGPKRILRQLFREELRRGKSGMKGAVRWGPEAGPG